MISGQGNFGTRRIPHADSYINTKIKLSKNGEKLLENVHSEKMPFVPSIRGEGVLMNLKELVKNYADYRGRIER